MKITTYFLSILLLTGCSINLQNAAGNADVAEQSNDKVRVEDANK